MNKLFFEAEREILVAYMKDNGRFKEVPRQTSEKIVLPLKLLPHCYSRNLA